MAHQKEKLQIVSDLPREAIVTFLVTGIEEGLVQNNWRKSMDTSGNKSGPRIQKTPKDEAESVTYRLNDRPEPGLKTQQLYILNKAFFSGMIKKKGGAKNIKIGKFSASQQISTGTVFSIHKYCPLFNPKTKKPLIDFELYRDRVKRGSSYVIVHRPLIPEWACYAKAKVDERFITVQQLLDTFKRTGKVAGAGDNRPQMDGYYGKYDVEIEEIEVLHVFGEKEKEVEEEKE